MEGIETADALLSQVYPKADFTAKDRAKKDRANIAIERLKMDRLENLLVPTQPVSLLVNPTKKL